MAAGLEPLVVFWKAQGIQVLVLLSLALQVTLLVSAEIRRRKDSGVLRAVVWSAYLLADTTATYALGHMSVVTTLPGHELAAFWAPFLLLHLGGQDNITAYSIEDNRLWLRHLQSFAVQVLVAAYVLYESSVLAAGGGLRQAAILMSAVGVVKYGERVWALRRAGSSSLSGKNYQSFGRVRVEIYHRPDEWRAEAFRAHLLLNLPKHLLKGPLPVVAVDMDGTCGWELMYRVAEMQLSLMYDVLYIKAELIHTWYGYCVRAASLAATVAASLLFHRFAGKDGYGRADVAATYVLLAGAVALETTSVLTAMLSSWKYTLVTRERTPASLVLAIMVCLPSWPFELARSAMMRRRGGRGTHTATKYWSGSMGQHSLIHMCSRAKDSRSSKVARWAGREDWWNMLAYTSSVPVSAHTGQLLKKQVMQSAGVEGDSPDHIHTSRGRAALKRRGLHEELGWSVDAELDESILIWHVATHVYLRWQEVRARRPPAALARATEELSNYMMFLLAARPHMLPDNVSRQRYVELCDKVINHLRYSSADDLLRQIRDRGDKLGNGGKRRPAGAGAGAAGSNASTFQGSVTFDRAAQLGAKLISKELETPDASMLELISEVWVEMLCYAGYRCRPDSHARQLSNGGEITTIVALMLEYMKSNFLLFREEDKGVPGRRDTTDINAIL